MSEPLTPVTSPAIREPHYERVGLGALGASGGALVIQNMAEAVSVAQLMAKSGIAIRKHLREQPGACLGVLMQAMRWEFDPYMVANKSYDVNDQLAYEAQLLAAVVLTRAAIVDEPDYTYDGEDATRTCTVAFKMRSGKILTYTTPEIGKIKVQNSPLWKSDPDQQLGYFAVRSWARRHQPHVLLGVYTVEEASEIIDVTPNTSGVASRLPGAQNGDGFNGDNVRVETERAAPKATRGRKPKAPEPAPEPEEAMHAAEEPATEAEFEDKHMAAAPDPTGEFLAEGQDRPQPDAPAAPEPESSSTPQPSEEPPEDGDATTASEEEALPADMQTFIDAVESVPTFVAVKQAMSTFFATDTFKGMDPDQQNHVRYQTWMTLVDRKDEGAFSDLPNPAADVSAFRLWIETMEDPDLITDTLGLLEAVPSFEQKDETFKAGVRNAAAVRIAKL